MYRDFGVNPVNLTKPAKALDLRVQGSVSATTPGHPGLAPVAVPTGAATSGENTMTNKPLRKKSQSRVAKACPSYKCRPAQKSKPSRVMPDSVCDPHTILLHGVLSNFRSRATRQLEIIAPLHQLDVLRRNQRSQSLERPKYQDFRAGRHLQEGQLDSSPLDWTGCRNRASLPGMR